MASRASRAAERMEADRAKREAGTRETGTGTTLKSVPQDPPPATKGDEARTAAVAQLPAHQQAEYARLTGGGTRHVTALAAARKLPDPATPVDDIAKAAADLFGGASAPPVTVAAAAGRPKTGDTTPPPAPAPKPAASAPAPKPPPAAKPPVPTPPPAPRPAAEGDGYRHIGTVTTTTLDGEQVFDCKHGARNGHMDEATAWACANRLLRSHPDGVTGTRLHPVRRDRNGRRLS